MTVDVENIIKQKKFFELTEEELQAVSEYATTEAEYEDLQWFLTSTGEAFEAEKIEASSELKERVMSHLTESKKKRGFWMNSVGGFFFPEGKKIYQMPAVQVGMAAVVVLGLFLFIDNPFKSNLDERDLAYEDIPVEQELLNLEETTEEVSSGESSTGKLEDEVSREDGDAEGESNIDRLVADEDKRPETAKVDESPDATVSGTTSNGYTFALDEAPAEEAEEMEADDLSGGDYYRSNTVLKDANNESQSDKDQDGIKGEDRKTETKNLATTGGIASTLGKKRDRDEPSTDNRIADPADNGEGGKVAADAEVSLIVMEEAKEKEKSEKVSENKKQTSDNNQNAAPASAYDQTTVTEDLKTREQIKSKSLHIKQTTELKSLFFTVK